MENSFSKNPEIEKIMQKTLQEKGFIGGDTKEYVIRAYDSLEEDDKTEEFEDNNEWEETEDFIEKFEDWREYMSAFANIDVEGYTPLELRDLYTETIDELRTSLAELKETSAKLSQQEQSEMYQNISYNIQRAQSVLQQIENYLMVNPGWKKK
jgi:hypothetical protein